MSFAATRAFRFGRLLIIVALFGACGGHWLVLQSIAWSGMLLEYAHTSGVVIAVEKTFDGQHPCEICKSIEQGKKSQKKTDLAPLLIAKLEFFHNASRTTPAHPRIARTLRVSDSVDASRIELPRLRPPRVA